MNVAVMDMSDEDAKLLTGILISDEEASVILPDKIGPEAVHGVLMVTSRAVGSMRRATARLFPLIGRLLCLARDQPDTWQERGHKSYDSYLTTEVVPAIGMSRSQLLGIRRIYECWPSLPLSTYEQLGSERLKILATISKQSDPSAGDSLERALTLPAKDLKVWAERERHLEPGSLESGVVSFATTKEVEDRWQAFWTDPTIQAHAGDTQGGILMSMISECEGTWLAQGETPSE